MPPSVSCLPKRKLEGPYKQSCLRKSVLRLSCGWSSLKRLRSIYKGQTVERNDYQSEAACCPNDANGRQLDHLADTAINV